MQLPDKSAIQALQAGELSHLLIGVSAASLQKVCVLSGSFNPLHKGHQEMAGIAIAKTGLELVYELCIKNVDKPPLTVLEAQRRVDQPFLPNRLVLTAAPTFQEKSALFGQSTFVVGADTIERIADPRYYDNDADKRDEAISAIHDADCGFLVFGRSFPDAKPLASETAPNRVSSFRSLDDLRLPDNLRSLCAEVPQAEFDISISSTQIRNQQIEPPPI